MNFLSFLRQYITKPRTVGAILPSSKYLAKKMIQNIDFANANYIIEYGPGTGVFTDKILEQKKANTILILFENNEEFYKLLNEKYHELPNLHIVNDSAEHIGRYMQKYDIPYIDYVISGLPFASLPNEVSSNILTETARRIKPGGGFITFQYTLLKKSFMEQFFPNIYINIELRNIPPAYVFNCKLDK